MNSSQLQWKPANMNLKSLGMHSMGLRSPRLFDIHPSNSSFEFDWFSLEEFKALAFQDLVSLNLKIMSCGLTNLQVLLPRIANTVRILDNIQDFV